MFRSTYVPGDYNAVCDVCGFVHKASQLRTRWDGMKVCRSDWEPRHPQELLRSRAERPAPPWTRPQPEDTFIVVNMFQLGERPYDTVPLLINDDQITLGEDDITL